MVKGFQVDTRNSANSGLSYGPMLWIKGEPRAEQGIFGPTGDFSLERATKNTVRSLRCDKCGFLELYAI